MSRPPQARVEATALTLLTEAQERDMWISGDIRIGIDDAAKLLGMTPASFKNRIAGTGLPVYQLGGRGNKRSVRLHDLAEWVESLTKAA